MHDDSRGGNGRYKFEGRRTKQTNVPNQVSTKHL
jgi:hypothetical protein